MIRLVTLAAIAAPLGLAGVPALADHLCNTTLPAGTTTLTHNHDCSGTSGLIIGADMTRIDLNGYVLKGNTTGFPRGVDNSGGFDDVQVRNGVIEGFSSAVHAIGGTGLELIDLTITGPRDYHAVDVLDSANLQIRNSSFTIPAGSPWWVEHMRLESVDGVLVERVDVLGGFIGVNFACGDCDQAGGGSEPPTNGEVKGSVFHGTVIGVLIANSTDAEVDNNHMSGGVSLPPEVHGFGPFTIDSKGISADADFGSGTIVSGVKIEDNHVHDNDGLGIRLKGVTTSVVEGNEVHTNTGHGIALVGFDSTGSTGNAITDNISTGNGGEDMFQDGDSSPNTWQSNQCVNSDDSGSGEINCGS